MAKENIHDYPKNCKFAVMEGDSVVAVLLHNMEEKGEKRKKLVERVRYNKPKNICIVSQGRQERYCSNWPPAKIQTPKMCYDIIKERGSGPTGNI